MANVNSSSGLQNLPAQSITTTAQTALLVPAQGLYSTLPSPTFPAGAGLWTGPGQDIAGSVYDGHAFKVRVAGKYFTGAAATLTVVLTEVPATIVAAGTSATFANDQAVITLGASASTTGAANFLVEGTFIWDSVSQKLNGFVTGCSFNGAQIAATYGIATTSVTVPFTVAGGVNGLNFLPFFTFSVANAANTVTVTEFFVDRA